MISILNLEDTLYFNRKVRSWYILKGKFLCGGYWSILNNGELDEVIKFIVAAFSLEWMNITNGSNWIVKTVMKSKFKQA